MLTSEEDLKSVCCYFHDMCGWSDRVRSAFMEAHERIGRLKAAVYALDYISHKTIGVEEVVLFVNGARHLSAEALINDVRHFIDWR